jgi:hypothetical protein
MNFKIILMDNTEADINKLYSKIKRNILTKNKVTYS